MQKAHDASKNSWWRNYPNITTAITQDELNRIETTVDVIDDRVVELDLTKASQTDLYQSVKSISYNTQTGIWVFTWWNGSTLTVDQNIEKIPVSFSMSPQGVITMTTQDGTQYSCDVASLIKSYSFEDSSTIDFTDTIDSSGNHTIKAGILPNSITDDMMRTDYLADITAQANLASSSAVSAGTSALTSNNRALDSEAWAVGQRAGVPVTSEDDTYQNNSKYYASQTKILTDDCIDQINRALSIATFSVDNNGMLIYTDNSAFAFSVDNNGMLNWEVAV